MKGAGLLETLIAWYAAIPATTRRVALALLVPAAEYLGLEPVRHAFNSVAKVSPMLALAMLPLLLGAMVLMAAVIVLFALEYFKPVSRVHAPLIARIGILCIGAWVLLPLFLMRLVSG